MRSGDDGARRRDHARVTTVVVSQNRRNELLASLARHSSPVVYVDNASTDGSADAVRQRYPDILVVELERNEGAPGRNRGATLATTPYVAFADDDSWWAPGALDLAADLFDRHPRLALLAARILVGDEERLDPVCTEMEASPLAAADDLPGRPVLGFIACGAVVRRDAFLAVGGFDDVVFFPGEEERVALDLASTGWGLAYVPEVVAHHHPSPLRSSPERRQQQIARSALLTAVMRRPWSTVARRAHRGVRGSGATRAGVLSAVRDARRAVRRRRPVAESVERELRLLEAHEVAA